MSTLVDEVVTANAAYAKDFGPRSELALPPARKFAMALIALIVDTAHFL